MHTLLRRLYNFWFETQDDKELMIGFFLIILIAIGTVIFSRYSS